MAGPPPAPPPELRTQRGPARRVRRIRSWWRLQPPQPVPDWSTVWIFGTVLFITRDGAQPVPDAWTRAIFAGFYVALLIVAARVGVWAYSRLRWRRRAGGCDYGELTELLEAIADREPGQHIAVVSHRYAARGDRWRIYEHRFRAA